jgi:hypothetical protein
VSVAPAFFSLRFDSFSVMLAADFKLWWHFAHAGLPLALTVYRLLNSELVGLLPASWHCMRGIACVALHAWPTAATAHVAGCVVPARRQLGVALCTAPALLGRFSLAARAIYTFAPAPVGCACAWATAM